MADYLKNLQEINILNNSFLKGGKSDVITEEEFSEISVGDAGPLGVYMHLTQGDVTVGAAAAAAAIIYYVGKAVSRLSTTSECRKYSSSADRKKCSRIIKNRKKLATFKSKIGLCQKTKKPEACAARVTEKISKIEMELKNLGTISGTE
jgi:hypothetical protein